MTVTRTDAFKRDFKSLPEPIKEQVEKALCLLLENRKHPSLHVKKMQPKARGIFEARVTLAYRLTFCLGTDEIVLRRVGTHDVLRSP